MLVGALAVAVALAGALGGTAVLSHHAAKKTAAGGQQASTTAGATSRTPVIGDRDDAQLVLALAARTTQTETSTAIRPGQFVYRRTDEVALGTSTVAGKDLNIFSEQRQEAWLDPQHGLRAVRIRSTSGLNQRPATAKDAALAASAGVDLDAPPRTSDTDHPTSDKERIQPAPAGLAPSLRNPTPEYLAGLPTDPGKLLAVLRGAAKAEGNTKWTTDKTAFDIVGDLFELGDPMLSPALRAGLYGAIARMPAVARVDGQANLTGRRGIAIGFTEGGRRRDIILDTQTLHPIGSRDTQLTAAGGLPAGTVLAGSTFTFAVVAGTDRTN
jgi:hypothetical protein